jgi:hypothetical protein
MEKIIATVLMAALLVYAMVWLAKLYALGRRCKQIPRPGERWVFVEKQGPWPSKKYPAVLIVDVREGWVRYDMSTFKDQRMELDIFARLYRPNTEAQRAA